LQMASGRATSVLPYFNLMQINGGLLARIESASF